jgi:hypothetical protein
MVAASKQTADTSTSSRVERLKQECAEFDGKIMAIIDRVIDEGREFFYAAEAAELRTAGYVDAGRPYGDKIVLGRFLSVRNFMKNAGTAKEFAAAKQAVADAREREKDGERLQQEISKLQARLDRLESDRRAAEYALGAMESARDRLRHRDQLPTHVGDYYDRLQHEAFNGCEHSRVAADELLNYHVSKL